MSFKPGHDKFLKSILQQPARARDYFQEQLPADVLQALDMDTLRRVPDSFVDKNLRACFSDIL